MIPVTGNKLNNSKVALPKPKGRMVRKKANKKIKLVDFEPERIKIKLVNKKRGAY